MQTVLEAAQTGHLVLTTMHTRGSAKTLARILEFFASDKGDEILGRLSDLLLFILSQGLLPEKNINKYVLCVEFLQNSDSSSRSAIKDYIGSSNQLEDILKRKGNFRWDKYLRKLYNDDCITEETLYEYAHNADAATSDTD